MFKSDIVVLDFRIKYIYIYIYKILILYTKSDTSVFIHNNITLLLIR